MISRFMLVPLSWACEIEKVLSVRLVKRGDEPADLTPGGGQAAIGPYQKMAATPFFGIRRLPARYRQKFCLIHSRTRQNATPLLFG